MDQQRAAAVPRVRIRPAPLPAERPGAGRKASMASEAEDPVGEPFDPDPAASRKFPHYDGWGPPAGADATLSPGTPTG
jgi:hypothetical protein